MIKLAKVIKLNVEFKTRKGSIADVLETKLGRKPTHAELIAEVKRILKGDKP